VKNELLEAERVRSIVGCFYEVYNYFGYGLVESVYTGALDHELTSRGHDVAREVAVRVGYKGRHIAWQRLDMLVDRKVIVEIKATEKLPLYAQRQLVSYLTASPYHVAVLLHFAPEPKFYRFVDSAKRSFTLVPAKATTTHSDASRTTSTLPGSDAST
jgi:GxxExxY protein